MGAERQRERPPGHAAVGRKGTVLPRAVRVVRRRAVPARADHWRWQRLGYGNRPEVWPGRPHRRGENRPGYRPPRRAVPPRAALLRPAGDGPRRRWAVVPAQEHRSVRPDHLRPARLADADLAILEFAPGELPVHGAVLPGGAPAPDLRRGDRSLQLLSRGLAHPQAVGHARTGVRTT